MEIGSCQVDSGLLWADAWEGMDTAKVAVCQMTESAAVADSIGAIDVMAAQAAEGGAELAVFPELSLTG